MSVEQLEALLKPLPRNMQVILQKDCEGNGFSPLDCIDLGLYIPNNDWSGEIDLDRGKTPDSVILIPIN